MKRALRLKNICIVPNGVDMDFFSPLAKLDAQLHLGWSKDATHILFAADPGRKEKNFILAQIAFSIFNGKNSELHYLKDIPKREMPYFYSASDAVLITSLWEGSPNVIKEAMSCGRPIVATNVGDIHKVISNTEGCFVCNFNAEEIAESLRDAIKIKETNGRCQIGHLKDEIIAKKILSFYEKVSGRDSN